MSMPVSRRPSANLSEAALMDDVWRQIEELVDQVAQLSRAPLSEAKFYACLLDCAMRAGAAVGGAVWQKTADGRFLLLGQVNLAMLGLAERGPASDQHDRLLESVVQSRRIKSAAPQSGSPEIENPTPYHSLACPVMADDAVERIVEVFQSPDISPDAVQSYSEVLATFCDLAADFHRNLRLRQLEQRESIWQQVEQFAEKAHAEVDLNATAYAIVNEGRRLVGCDRLSLTVRRRRRYEIVAISGIDNVDRRAESVRCLERLAVQVARTGETVWYDGHTEELPPQIAAAVEALVEQSHARRVTIVPLRKQADQDTDKSPPRPDGVLIFEHFAPQETRETLGPKVEAASRHGASALRNALALDRLPLARLLRRLAWVAENRRWLRFLAAGFAIAVLVAALTGIRVPFYLRCTGELQPELRRHVFAPFDGQVEQLMVSHGDEVAAGQTLLRLSSDALDLEYTRILGETETTAEQLSAIQAARLAPHDPNTTPRDQFASLAAEEQRLKKTLDNLREQQTLLEQQRERMTLCSPIAGRVLTWELDETLNNRPVQRGQALMMVADTSGPWVVEIRVPDRDVGILRAAPQAAQGNPDVTFVLATHPEVMHHGRLQDLALTSEANPTQGVYARGVVAFDQKIPNARPGAEVRARIHCGQRSLGYVWLRDFIDAIRRWLFL